MKKISIIAVTILLMIACKKDVSDLPSDISAQDQLVSETSSPVTRSITLELYSSANPASPSLTCSMPGVPFGIANSGYFLHGTATHLGRVDSEFSMGLDDFCHLSPSLILTTHTAGEIVAANGDKISYTGNDLIDLTNVVVNGGTTGTITGLWTITGGTGRFTGASGSFTINGIVDVAAAGGPSIIFTGVGTITY